MTSLESARDFLSGLWSPGLLKFRGVPLQEFTQEELIKILFFCLETAKHGEAAVTKLVHYEDQMRQLRGLAETRRDMLDTQGAECERRHNLLCEVKEVVDRYFGEN